MDRDNNTDWLSGDNKSSSDRGDRGNRRRRRRRQGEEEDNVGDNNNNNSEGSSKVAETKKGESKFSEKSDSRKASKGWGDDDDDNAPPKNGPSSGWGDEGKTSSSRGRIANIKKEKKKKSSRDNFFDDDEGDDIPVIPDLEEEEDEVVEADIANAPKARARRMSSIRELDLDIKLSLRDHVSAGVEWIDLSLLTSSLAPQQNVGEQDIPWEFDDLFERVAQEIHAEEDKSSSSTLDGVSDGVSNEKLSRKRGGRTRP
jgi:intraflagellar transport protein 43